jgi:hypothetical protein
MGQPDYVHSLSEDIAAIEESTEIEVELTAAKTVDDVRACLERHRSFYLAMSSVERGVFNDRIKELFARLP